jgi:hypothetical protein
LNFGINVLATAADQLTPVAIRSNNAAIVAAEVVETA